MNYNSILSRETVHEWCQSWLMNYDNLQMDDKKAIFICGESGVGKSVFVHRLLTSLNYDVIKFDSGDIRGFQMIEQISQNNIAKESIMSWVSQTKKRVAIVINEIDVINSVDKSNTISSLIKLIRPKKTKRQELEMYSLNPVICIGNITNDRTIDDLLQVCHVVELKTPTNEQVKAIMRVETPIISNWLDEDKREEKKNYWNRLLAFVKGNLTRLLSLLKVYKDTQEEGQALLHDLKNIYTTSAFLDDSKMKTEILLENTISMQQHQEMICDTERNILNLLWHENVVDYIPTCPPVDECHKMETYVNMLDNICFSDFYDRLVLQKQINQFNEMTSFIKTGKNNYLFHQAFPRPKASSNDIFSMSSRTETLQKQPASLKPCNCVFSLLSSATSCPSSTSSFICTCSPIPLETTKEKKRKKNMIGKEEQEFKGGGEKQQQQHQDPAFCAPLRGKKIRFTKILTKYATEFNNFLFVQGLCGFLNVDKKDALGLVLSQLQDSCEERKSRNLFSQINEQEMKHKADFVHIHPLVVFFQQFGISFSFVARLLKYMSHGQILFRCKELTSFEHQSSNWTWIRSDMANNLNFNSNFKYPCLQFHSFLSFPGLKEWVKESQEVPPVGTSETTEVFCSLPSLLSSAGQTKKKKRKLIGLLTKTQIINTASENEMKKKIKTEKNNSDKREKKIKHEKPLKLDNIDKREKNKNYKREKEKKNSKIQIDSIDLTQHISHPKEELEDDDEKEKSDQQHQDDEDQEIKDEDEEEIQEEEIPEIMVNEITCSTYSEPDDDDRQKWINLGFSFESISFSETSTATNLTEINSGQTSKRQTIKNKNKSQNLNSYKKSSITVLSDSSKENKKEKDNLMLFKQQMNFRNFLNTNKNKN